MSQIVSFNFKQAADECCAMCGRIDLSIERLAKQIGFLEATVSGVDMSQANAYAQQLRDTIASWRDNIQSLLHEAEETGKTGVWQGDSYSHTYANRFALANKVNQLMLDVEQAIAAEMPAVNAMLHMISEQRDSHIQKLIEERNNPRPHCEWDSISDPELRQFTYLAHLANPGLKGDDLLAEGIRMRDGHAQSEKKRLRQEMEDAKVEPREIEQALSGDKDIATLNQCANQAIVSEELRKKAIKKIRKCVQQRGFMVDKGNIRKNGDTVTMIAHKIGGETATFTINIDGSFIYDFQGYEDQACQKDIEPFVKDLEEVYGVDLMDRKEIWSNPDKILTQKRQTMNINHNKK